jgi:hypothetical protein
MLMGWTSGSKGKAGVVDRIGKPQRRIRSGNQWGQPVGRRKSAKSGA